MFVSPNVLRWRLNPKCDVFWGGALGRELGLDELIRMEPSRWDDPLPLPLFPLAHTEKRPWEAVTRGQPSANQEGGSPQPNDLPAPWSCFSQPSQLRQLSVCCFGHQVYSMGLEQPELPETSSEQRGHSNMWLNLGDDQQRPSSVFPIFPKHNGTKTFFSELRALAHKRL